MQEADQNARRTPSATLVGDLRTVYEHDRARIIHSSSFRRLQGKTQVLGIAEGDFHRTRLTHSMEAAQIGRGIVITLHGGKSERRGYREWLPPKHLIEAICLAHDLGHPPFGHAGERALNYCMRDSGGFEGNGQTIRLLSTLESHTSGHGLNLTRRTLLGVLKYPATYGTLNNVELYTAKKKAPSPIDYKPPKCYFDCDAKIVDWILSPFNSADRETFVSHTAASGPNSSPAHSQTSCKAFDTSIMELADDIAYAVHDIEDAVALRLITRDEWNEYQSEDTGGIKLEKALGDAMPELLNVADELFSSHGWSRKSAIGKIVNALVTRCDVTEFEQFESPLLRFNACLPDQAKRCIKGLKGILRDKVIRSFTVNTLESRGARIVAGLYDALSADPEGLLPPRFREDASDTHAPDPARLVCDYIAGMTDEFATRYYERLYVPRHGSVFERL